MIGYIVGSKSGKTIVTKTFEDEYTASKYVQGIKSGSTSTRVAYGRIPAKMTIEAVEQAMREQLK